MSFDEVKASLEKGTVIFNSAGAHISEVVAPATLAAQDGIGGGAAGVCCNLYVTRSGAVTSAPPHTDKQDVVVIQTQGKKHWRVYSPPDPSHKSHVESFARGKGDDDFPLHVLKEQGGELLLDVVLTNGDVLFIPARFPHTTDTVEEGENGGELSIHMTFGLDNHVWDLDYATIRRFGLLRAGASDALGDPSRGNKIEDPIFVGKINSVGHDIHESLTSGLPRRWLSVYPEVEVGNFDRVDEISRLNREIAENVLKLCERIDGNEAGLDLEYWVSVVERFRESGQEVLSTHRDMYLAAIEEGRKRRKEGDGPMTQEKIDRLSLFRVPAYFDKLDKAKGNLREWVGENLGGEGGGGGATAIPDDWATSWKLKVGDPVEADLGGCMFPAAVTKVNDDGTYDVQFFDGEMESGLPRAMILLKVMPTVEQGGGGGKGGGKIDLEALTKKEIKKLRKQGLID